MVKSSFGFPAVILVMATGAHPRWLDIPGLPKERTLTNESLFDLTDAPKHLAIVGQPVSSPWKWALLSKSLVSKSPCLRSMTSPLTSQTSPEAAQVIQAALDRHSITTYYNATAKSYDEKPVAHLRSNGGQ